jgi:hypothetical protein
LMNEICKGQAAKALTKYRKPRSEWAPRPYELIVLEVGKQKAVIGHVSVGKESKPINQLNWIELNWIELNWIYCLLFIEVHFVSLGLPCLSICLCGEIGRQADRGFGVVSQPPRCTSWFDDARWEK